MISNLPIIVGPTAVGKTAIAIELAEEIGAEIISADSMLVYRGMDIGTAKPSAEERARVPHHLIDVADPREDFSVGQYLRLAEAAIADITGRGKIPLVVGGTGLYVRALTDGLFEGASADPELREGLLERENSEPGTLYAQLKEADAEAAARIHPSDIRRIVRALEVFLKEGKPISEVHREHKAGSHPRPANIVGLTLGRPALYRRIEERVDTMMAGGFLDEVRGLREQGCTREMTSMYALGYKQLLAHLDGETTLEEAVGLIKRDTKRYAKRQFTWFNAVTEVRWIDLSTRGSRAEVLEEIKKGLDIFRFLR
jgi:tRNA dimethylallyltransferase